MTASAATESQIRALMETVDRADRAGNRQEAERVLARAQAAAPDRPGVLNVAGVRVLPDGDPPRRAPARVYLASHPFNSLR